MATLETSREDKEWSEFLNYEEAVKINAALFDHTAEGTTFYSQRLSGSEREKTGLARSFSVLPGAVVSAKVFAKYVDPDQNNWQGNLPDLMAAIAGNSGGIVIDGGGVSPQSFPLSAFLAKDETDVIKAYLNIIIVDENYNFVDGGFQGVGPEARETGTDIAHQELITQQYTISKPGYVYVYLSNEQETPVDVFFDDLTVTHQHGPVVQADDYYPFGLTFNSYQREGGLENKYLYNGIEKQVDLDLGVSMAKYRTLDPALGRWWQIDPVVEGFESLTPYNSNLNNPIRYDDPLGDCPLCPPSQWELDAVASGEMGRGIFDSFVSTAKGLYDAVTSPVETAKGIYNAVTSPIETAKAVYNTPTSARLQRVLNKGGV